MILTNKEHGDHHDHAGDSLEDKRQPPGHVRVDVVCAESNGSRWNTSSEPVKENANMSEGIALEEPG